MELMLLVTFILQNFTTFYIHVFREQLKLTNRSTFFLSVFQCRQHVIWFKQYRMAVFFM